MTDDEAFEIWWREQTRKGDPALRTNLTRDAFLAACEVGRNAERERCAAIVEAARFDEVDRDWRSIGHMIDGGLTVEQIKAH